MRETDAKQLICPFMSGEYNSRCMGAVCMMWRWSDSGLVWKQGAKEPTALPNDERGGYCGAGGKP